MELHRGTTVLLKNKAEVRRAIIKFSSHNGQALELQFEGCGDLILVKDEERRWRDPTGEHWDLEIVPLTKAAD